MAELAKLGRAVKGGSTLPSGSLIGLRGVKLTSFHSTISVTFLWLSTITYPDLAPTLAGDLDFSSFILSNFIFARSSGGS